jgi:hypothetical protein
MSKIILVICKSLASLLLEGHITQYVHYLNFLLSEKPLMLVAVYFQHRGENY